MSNTQSGAGLDGATDGVDTGLVTGDARHVSTARPTAIAVHDYGDVRRQAVRIQSLRKQPVGITRPECVEKSFHA